MSAVSHKEMAEWSEAVDVRDWRTITRMVREYIQTSDDKQSYSLGEWLEDVQDPDTALGESDPKTIAMVWDRIRDDRITPTA